jgi:hypothetical protein
MLVSDRENSSSRLFLLPEQADHLPLSLDRPGYPDKAGGNLRDLICGPVEGSSVGFPRDGWLVATDAGTCESLMDADLSNSSVSLYSDVTHQ